MRKEKTIRNTLFISSIPLLFFPILTSCGNNSDIEKKEHIQTNTRLIGHRGLPTKEDVLENTIPSWIAAGEDDRYWGIETDVYPTNSLLEPDHKSKLVCAHDSTPFRDTEGNRLFDKHIVEMSFKECLSYPLIHSYGYPRTVDGLFAHGYDKEKSTFIPKFTDYLDVCLEYKKVACIEIKCEHPWNDPNSDWTKESVATLMNQIFQYSSKGLNYVLLDFDCELLQYIRNAYSDIIPMQVLYDQNADPETWGNLKWLAEHNWSVDIGDCDDKTTLDWGIHITKDIVDMFHSKGLQVNTWIIDYYDEYEYLSSIGVDFITSDCNIEGLFD